LRAVFVTVYGLEENSFEDICIHQMKALLKNFSVKVLCEGQINPNRFGLEDSPYLWDYLAFNSLEDENPAVSFFNGSPFGKTAKMLKDKGSTIIVYYSGSNLETTIEEYNNQKVKYALTYMIDPFLWSLYVQHIKEADIIICTSNYIKDYLERKMGLTDKRFEIIPYGTTLPNSIPPYPNSFTVGNIGVYCPEKGQIYLLRAIKKFVNAPNLIIAGFGTEYLGGLGYIPDNNFVYSQSSIYVQPSVTEDFSFNALEAMANGRPVIVTEGSGVSEIVKNGKEGFIVPIRNPDAIEEKINYFIKEPDEIKRMGSNARKKAEAYSWNKIEDSYSKVFFKSVW
jgi:glycosyltransferase involved in cell wall biosynthesis